MTFNMMSTVLYREFLLTYIPTLHLFFSWVFFKFYPLYSSLSLTSCTTSKNLWWPWKGPQNCGVWAQKTLIRQRCAVIVIGILLIFSMRVLQELKQDGPLTRNPSAEQLSCLAPYHNGSVCNDHQGRKRSSYEHCPCESSIPSGFIFDGLIFSCCCLSELFCSLGSIVITICIWLK